MKTQPFWLIERINSNFEVTIKPINEIQMKKIYFSLLAIGALLSAEAQLTQANHAPSSGDTFKMYQCDSVAPGASGAAVSWNFAVTTHSSILMNYSATAVTNPSYPMATIGVAATATNTYYYSSSANSLLYYGGNIGVGMVLANLNYTTPAIYASYPMSLNSTSNSAIGGSITVTSPVNTNGTFLGTNTVVADGTGTLTVAGMTYSNVMRLKITQVINFTTTIAGGIITQENFQYYESGTKAPVMTIETSTANLGFLGTTSQTIAMHVKGAATSTVVNDVGISKNTGIENAVHVYPNPANSEVSFLNPSNSAVSVSVYDVTGKLVETKLFSSVWAKIDVSDYQQGMYIYRVNGENNHVLNTGKLTVVH